MLEPVVTTHADPPPAMIAHAAALTDVSAFWLRPRPFATRCFPTSPRDDVKLVVCSGHGVLQQGGNTAVLRPGLFSWLDPSASFSLSVDRGQLMILRLARQALSREHPLLDLTPAIERGGAGAEGVAANAFSNIVTAGDSLSNRERLAATQSMQSMLALCTRTPAPTAASRRVERALEFMQSQLHRATLQASDVSEHQRVSRRFLDRAFTSVLGVSIDAAIRERRLRAAANDLLSDEATSVAEISARWGFSDPSHFARAFRRRFHQTPRAYRDTNH
jgi:AraC family transcriptional regulator, positive regulator of tynA and feaB